MREVELSVPEISKPWFCQHVAASSCQNQDSAKLILSRKTSFHPQNLCFLPLTPFICASHNMQLMRYLSTRGVSLMVMNMHIDQRARWLTFMKGDSLFFICLNHSLCNVCYVYDLSLETDNWYLFSVVCYKHSRPVWRLVAGVTWHRYHFVWDFLKRKNSLKSRFFCNFLEVLFLFIYMKVTGALHFLLFIK